MKPIAILYATREGQTRRIAERVAADVGANGRFAEVRDVKALPPTFSLADYDAVILAASIHLGRHEREMVNFVKEHRATLERMSTAFLSVSMSEANAESVELSPELRARASQEVQNALHRFVEETEWKPERMKPLAGALLYTQYNVLVRFVMKRIARQTGGNTDTSVDHEYTDWLGLDAFVKEIIADLPR